MLIFTSLVLVLTACASGSEDGADDAPVLVIEDGDIVDVHYVLTLDGSLIETFTSPGAPTSMKAIRQP